MSRCAAACCRASSSCKSRAFPFCLDVQTAVHAATAMLEASETKATTTAVSIGRCVPLCCGRRQATSRRGPARELEGRSCAATAVAAIWGAATVHGGARLRPCHDGRTHANQEVPWISRACNAGRSSWLTGGRHRQPQGGRRGAQGHRQGPGQCRGQGQASRGGAQGPRRQGPRRAAGRAPVCN
jgi:hypothetical protein